MKNASVTVFGMGYIGLPTATVIAGKGIPVCGVDTNPNVLETLNKGKIHIVEPDLEGLVKIVVERQLLKVSSEISPSDIYMVAVPTPIQQDKTPDTSFVLQVIENLIPHLKPHDLVIIESTCPVGTTEAMYQKIIAQRPELKDAFYMAYCPERVLPGKIIHELVYNDRILGGINEISSQKAKEFYQQFVKGDLLLTTANTAEMCKLTENAYRDVNIAFANELSLMADEARVDVWELIRLANRHPRVNILQPGVGVGGHCIAVDPWFLIAKFADKSSLIHQARKVNLSKTAWVIQQIEEKAKQIDKPKIACMGIAFKPDIDDLRESPALEITQHLIQKGYEVQIVEPNLKSHSVYQLTDAQTAVENCDIMAFLVNHSLFKQLKIQDKEKIMDFCGVFTS